MKAHIGVDAETGLVHGVRATPANTHDLREAGALLHGGEEEVWADAGYRGIEKWVDREAARCSGMWRDRGGGSPGAGRGAVAARTGHASVRAKVHPFLVKRRFGYREGPRYRGLAKNMERIACSWASRTCSWRAAIRRRERPARETSAHAGRNEGIIGRTGAFSARHRPQDR